ncbi:OB-fold protein [Flavobacterium sp.]|uniref:OB-fold protein n=1 Tax=Flavobacterium sp. TaxID=239 RepID=UPI00286E942D|nr:hypothetical protein [Flavobacterium sp.]
MKKIFFIAIIAIVSVYLGYSYLYKGARDYASEETIKIESVLKFNSELAKDEVNANKKYLNKIIEISGIVTQIDAAQKAILIDEKLFAIVVNSDFEKVKLNSNVHIKGRFLGYDELLEEIKLDNCYLIQ